MSKRPLISKVPTFLCGDPRGVSQSPCHLWCVGQGCMFLLSLWLLLPTVANPHSVGDIRSSLLGLNAADAILTINSFVLFLKLETTVTWHWRHCSSRPETHCLSLYDMFIGNRPSIIILYILFSTQDEGGPTLNSRVEGYLIFMISLIAEVEICGSWSQYSYIIYIVVTNLWNL